MTWTKRMIVEQAFDELALAGYIFDLTPDELQSCRRRLDTMIAAWAGNGVQLSYAYSDGANALEQESGLPMVDLEAVYLNLAVRTAASKGKILSTSTKAAARAAYDALVSRKAREEVQEQQLRNGTPRGAGWKNFRGSNLPFTTVPDTSPIQIGEGGGLDLTGA